MSANRFVRSPGFVRAGVGAIAIVGLAIVAYAIFGSSAPRERDRVTHPAGYSIVKPSDWIAKMVIRPSGENVKDAIMLGPESWKGLAPGMWVKRLTTAPDPQDLQDTHFVEGTFEGHPAWLRMVKPKRNLIREATFQSGGDWFNLGVSLPGYEGLNADEWWRFLETFHGPASITTQKN